MTLPIPPSLHEAYERFLKAESTPETPETIQLFSKMTVPSMLAKRNHAMSDLQQEIVAVAAGLVENKRVQSQNLKTVHEGAVFVREQLAKWQQQQQKETQQKQ
jgi:hypothetical protein